MKQEEFYIGYLAKAPVKISKFIKKIIFLIFLLLILLSFFLVYLQKGFAPSAFELGRFTTLQGVLYEDPQPFLKVLDGKDIYGNPVYKNVLLINYGKFGAASLIHGFKEEIGTSFDSVLLSLEGTLIYYDGVTLLELTKKGRSLKSFETLNNISAYQRSIESLGEISLEGEIIDPKCYFGVMKPGYGKTHRSCAIRCISGGIPPVLKVGNDKSGFAYYLLLGTDGQMINQNLLDKIAEPVQISGTLKSVDEWQVVYFNPETQLERSTKLSESVSNVNTQQ